MKYIGLNLSIEDSSTGAETTFHRICSISINRRNGGVTATFDSYASQEKWQQGRQPVSFMQQISVTLVETDDMNTMDLDSWIYQEVSKTPTDVYGHSSPLLDAVLVEA